MTNIKWQILLLIMSVSFLSCEKTTYTLSSTISPSLSGSVTPSTGTYEKGEVVNLVAQPNVGWVFQKWEGDISGTSSTATITMNGNKNVVAVFLRREYPLNIEIIGEGTIQEKIVSTPSKSYPFETIVELTPVPKAGWMFDCWEGDILGFEVPKILTIDKEKRVIAKFIKSIQVFGGNGTDYISDATHTKDGGFIAVGTTVSNDGIFSGLKISRSFDICVIKFDKNGERQWVKVFGGAGQEMATKVIQTKEGDYLITGESGSNDADFIGLRKGVVDVFLLKLNSSGEKIWIKTYGESGKVDYAYSLAESHDGGFVIVGESVDSNDIFIMKVNSDGEKMWSKWYGGSNSQNVAYDVIKTIDDGFVITGIANTSNGNFKELSETENIISLIKINSVGEIQWISSNPGSNRSDIMYAGNQVIETNDGGFIVVGREFLKVNEESSVLSYDMVVSKYNSSGKLSWKKSFGGSKFDGFFDVVQISTNEIVIVGYFVSTDGYFSGLNSGADDVFIIKLSTNGDILWQKSYGGSKQDMVGSIVKVQDGKLFVVGSTSSNNGIFFEAPFLNTNIFTLGFR